MAQSGWLHRTRFHLTSPIESHEALATGNLVTLLPMGLLPLDFLIVHAYGWQTNIGTTAVAVRALRKLENGRMDLGTWRALSVEAKRIVEMVAPDTISHLGVRAYDKVDATWDKFFEYLSGVSFPATLWHEDWYFNVDRLIEDLVSPLRCAWMASVLRAPQKKKKEK